MRCGERDGRSFLKGFEDAVESRFARAPTGGDIRGPWMFEVRVVFIMHVLPEIPALEKYRKAVMQYGTTSSLGKSMLYASISSLEFPRRQIATSFGIECLGG